MVDEPGNLVLALMREMHREIAASMEAVNTSMKATHRIYAHLERFDDEMGSLRVQVAAIRSELEEFRTETARNFVRLESGLIQLENQNMSGHGETANAFRRLAELERQSI